MSGRSRRECAAGRSAAPRPQSTSTSYRTVLQELFHARAIRVDEYSTVCVASGEMVMNEIVFWQTVSFFGGGKVSIPAETN